MLSKIVLKKDHYDVECVIDCKNCEILQIEHEYVFIKINNETPFNELKKDINKLINRNSELYCDCKKVILLKNTFEEVIKVKFENENLKINERYNISLMVYGIWFSNKNNCSYGPMIKIKEILPLKKNNISFLQIDTDSDEEINHHYNNKKKN